jgi:outer membrane protein OmpA-like peptidoglycan-associated protein
MTSWNRATGTVNTAIALSALMLACSHEKRQPAVPSASQEQPALAASLEPEPVRVENPHADANGSSLTISQSIIRTCNLPDAPEEAPQFDYDQAALRPRGMGILRDVADCMQNGSLKGKSITIIGFADPRGTEDYNHALGMRRANATRDFLVSQGVAGERITVRSRGEADAVGTDPLSWQLDRRVEVAETSPVGE